MIKYALKCADGHTFESWFQSTAAFDKLHGVGMVTCAVCGSSDVEKAIMAPRVNMGTPVEAETKRPLTAEKTPSEQALARLKAHLEKNSDYVGTSFAEEARAIHDGDAPSRMIHGEANREDAIKLLQDGVPVAPLPFVLNRKAN